jgi:hypothetical protein
MSTYLKYALPTVIVGGAVAVFCFAQPVVVTPPAITVTPPTVVVAAPAPAPVVVVAAPADYYWDGTEYVGLVGDQYYYLGSDNTWIICDPIRLHRFQGWQHDHPDWHAHPTHNVNYHRMAGPPHPAPMHAGPQDHPVPHDNPDHHDNGPHGPPQ